ncbi:MAG: ATP-binding cassette domain-containing protein [Chitinophagales bacterium]|nr:ATP-binding cassette domain-containing protein [Chitinophagales bacterium]
MEPILSINNISKSYGPIQALKNVSFDVPPGCVFGILGPNGSGKTTMLGILLDVLKADAGTYKWMHYDNAEDARKKIGALLETPNFYHYLSAMDNLKIAAAIKQLPADDRLDVLEKVNLTQRKDSKFQTYSLGMKQRLAIASALMGKPQVLVFDEPTNGLDPVGIAEIRELIRLLNAQGHTIIMASHLLDEVEKVCTHVAILKKGDLLLSGPVDEVLRSEDQIEISSNDAQQLLTIIKAMPGIRDAKISTNTITLSCDENISTADINRYCADKSITLSHLLLKKKSLETKFMELTNN